MVQMKVTASILLAAAAIAPVVAQGFEAQDSLVTREDNEFESAFARDFDLELEERELDDDLFEREVEEELYGRARGGGGGGRSSSMKAGGRGMGRTMKFGGGGGGRGIRKASKGIGRVAAASVPAPETPSETREFNDDILEREFDEELYERARGGGGGGGRGFSMRTGGGGRGRMTRTGGGGGGRGRVMKFGGGGRGIRKGLGRVAAAAVPETPSETREFEDELFGRAGPSRPSGPRPKPTSAPKPTGVPKPPKPTSAPPRRNGPREFSEELEERDLDSHELFGRDVDLELFEREPEPFLFFNHIKKWWNNRKGKTPPAEDAAPETRSDDEMELLEREYYDELD